MTEGVTPYTRFTGTFSSASRLGVVVEGELQRVLRSTWGLVAVLAGVAVGVAFIGQLLEFRQAGRPHEMASVVTMLGWLLWSSLAVSAVTGATALLLDKQHGALELYFTRSLTPGEYLTGKCLAQFSLAAGVVFVPALAYFAIAFLLFGEHPEGWAMVLPVAAAVAVGWGLLVTGLALGISAVGRSVAGAVVLLLGAFAVVEVVLWRLVEALTDNIYVALISPMAVTRQLTAWMLGQPLPHEFEVVWAAAVWLVLVLVGWGLLFWRRPRVRGAEEVSG